MNDIEFMQRALELAHRAADMGEVPVGAVLVKGDVLLGEGWNQPITTSDPSAHAEIQAIRHAALSVKNYRLPGTTLYVSLEPCLMCFGALVNARVKRLVYGASDKRFGVINRVTELSFNHEVQITKGVLERECADLLTVFFKAKRDSQMLPNK